MSPAPSDRPPPRRRWRDYRTASGASPVREFLDSLSNGEAASVVAGMSEIRDRGLVAARHLQDDIWEVRVNGNRAAYRVLFAQEGERGRVLLGLEAFSKKTQKTPDRSIELAKRRLADWRRRGREAGPPRATSPRAAAPRAAAPRQARGVSTRHGRPSPLRRRGLDR